MPPPKKAAKKSAKKAAKHAHSASKDLRRAFEHQGRVEALQHSLKPTEAEAVETLVAFARRQLQAGEHKDAAELLRAAEHLSFAALVGEGIRGVRLSGDLQGAVQKQFDELSERADDHWDEEEAPETLVALYRRIRHNAGKAWDENEPHKALEYMRAAEALAHAASLGPLALDAGSATALAAKSRHAR